MKQGIKVTFVYNAEVKTAEQWAEFFRKAEAERKARAAEIRAFSARLLSRMTAEAAAEARKADNKARSIAGFASSVPVRDLSGLQLLSAAVSAARRAMTNILTYGGDSAEGKAVLRVIDAMGRFSTAAECNRNGEDVRAAAWRAAEGMQGADKAQDMVCASLDALYSAIAGGNPLAELPLIVADGASLYRSAMAAARKEWRADNAEAVHFASGESALAAERARDMARFDIRAAEVARQELSACNTWAAASVLNGDETATEAAAEDLRAAERFAAVAEDAARKSAIELRQWARRSAAARSFAALLDSHIDAARDYSGAELRDTFARLRDALAPDARGVFDGLLSGLTVRQAAERHGISKSAEARARERVRAFAVDWLLHNGGNLTDAARAMRAADAEADRITAEARRRACMASKAVWARYGNALDRAILLSNAAAKHNMEVEKRAVWARG